ncbi:MAG: hypothetical protein DRP27_04045 [Thermotogae bacterium]|nr:MAG: hypothetical protein DRP27_04045 [Thermotogota bacterium]
MGGILLGTTKNPRTVSQIELLKMSKQGIQIAEDELKSRMNSSKPRKPLKNFQDEKNEEAEITGKS